MRDTMDRPAPRVPPNLPDDWEGDEEWVIRSPTPNPRPPDDRAADGDEFIGKRPSRLRLWLARIFDGPDAAGAYWPTVGDLRRFAVHMDQLRTNEPPKGNPERFDPGLTSYGTGSPELERRAQIKAVRDRYRRKVQAPAEYWWERYL